MTRWLGTLGAVLLLGCASTPSPDEARWVVRVISSTPVQVFVGDQLMDWTSFVVEDPDTGKRYVVAGDKLCPKVGDLGLYRILVQERPIAFAVREGENVPTTRWYIWRCEKAPE